MKNGYEKKCKITEISFSRPLPTVVTILPRPKGRKKTMIELQGDCMKAKLENDKEAVAMWA